MSKIICDVCGTAYPDTASQCPICGCARPDHPQAAAGNSAGEQEDAGGGYTYVKGGRFSKSNVRRRNQNAAPAPRREVRQPMDMDMDMDEGPMDQYEERRLNPVVIAVVILIVAVLLIVAFIAVRFFAPNLFNRTPTTESTGSTTTAATSEPTSQPTSEPDVIPCTDLILTDTQITLDGRGRSWNLNPLPQPSDTTDQIVYTTSDENVAIVTNSGQITAVGGGTATITVTCGTVSKQVTVVCTVESESTSAPTSEPTNPPTSEPTNPPTSAPTGFKLNREDFTMFAKGEQWDVYDGASVGRDNIKWTSNDENVCTVERGIVTAVGPGDTTIVAEYEGQRLTCIVRVRITACTDITLPEVEIKLEAKGNSYTIKPVLTPSDTSDTVTYKSSDEKVAVVSDTGVVTAVGNGTATITVTCGSISKTLTVTCEFKEETTPPTSSPTTPDESTASS